MRTRSYRRHKFYSHLWRRINNYNNHNWGGNSKQEFIDDVMKGRYPWIRTTGRPCNCYDCSGSNKYKRLGKSELMKIVYNE